MHLLKRVQWIQLDEDRRGEDKKDKRRFFFFFFFFFFNAFSRRFYPKRLTLHSSYSFYILSALAFPGNRTHDLGVANAMLYQLSYRKDGTSRGIKTDE